MTKETLETKTANNTYAQTLGRGILVLEILAQHDGPMLLSEIAAELGLGRSVTYRLIRTLIVHDLIEIEANDRYVLGLGISRLAHRVASDAKSVTYPVLTSLAEEFKATVFLGIATPSFDGIVCVASVEPTETAIRVTFREGQWKPMNLGASSLAILSARPPLEKEREEITVARRVGFAVSRGELEEGILAVSAPVVPPHRLCNSALTVLFPDGTNVDLRRVEESLKAAARIVAPALASSQH